MTASKRTFFTALNKMFQKNCERLKCFFNVSFSHFCFVFTHATKAHVLSIWFKFPKELIKFAKVSLYLECQVLMKKHVPTLTETVNFCYQLVTWTWTVSCQRVALKCTRLVFASSVKLNPTLALAKGQFLTVTDELNLFISLIIVKSV